MKQQILLNDMHFDATPVSFILPATDSIGHSPEGFLSSNEFLFGKISKLRPFDNQISFSLNDKVTFKEELTGFIPFDRAIDLSQSAFEYDNLFFKSYFTPTQVKRLTGQLMFSGLKLKLLNDDYNDSYDYGMFFTPKPQGR